MLFGSKKVSLSRKYEEERIKLTRVTVGVAVVADLSTSLAEDDATAVADWRAPFVGICGEAKAVATGGCICLLWTAIAIVLP